MMKPNIHYIARKLIGFFRQKEKIESTQNIDHLWLEIERRGRADLAKRRKFQLLFSIGGAAAAVLFMLVLMDSHNKDHSSYDHADQIISRWNQDEMDGNDILLFISDDEKMNITSDAIRYDRDGTISLDEEKIESGSDPDAEIEYNRLYIPKGKRIQLTLADGSKLWVNSGTKVIYPRKFTQKTREIYVDGEILIDVTPDPEIPFIVKSGEFEVQVKGTTFNVCTYRGIESSVVLVNGSVNIKNAKGDELKLKPNEYVTVNSESFGNKKIVDTDKYIAWTNNLLVLEAEPLETVCRKLTLYYGTDFVIDEPAEKIYISGKLDLKENIENIILNLSKTAPISYDIQDGIIKIRKKN